MAARLVPSVLVFGFSVACGTGYPIGTQHARPLVLSDAERDLECPPDDIRVEELWGGIWEAVGCGKKMRYTSNCDSIRCEVHPEGEAAVPASRDRPSPLETPR
jgi:hypothetical protein